MESESFVSRVMSLIQKSRRALRLYSSAGSNPYSKNDSPLGDLSGAQVGEWREVNGLLLRRLTEAAEVSNTKKIIYDVFALRNEFQSLWRSTETELAQFQRELISSGESGDFIRAATLAASLVKLKARLQAAQAAHHELDLLIKRSKVVRPASELSEENATVLSTIELLDSQVLSQPHEHGVPEYGGPEHGLGGVRGFESRQQGVDAQADSRSNRVAPVTAPVSAKVLPLKKRSAFN